MRSPRVLTRCSEYLGDGVVLPLPRRLHGVVLPLPRRLHGVVLHGVVLPLPRLLDGAHDVGAARREAIWRCNLRARCALASPPRRRARRRGRGGGDGCVRRGPGRRRGRGGPPDAAVGWRVRRRTHSRRPGGAGAVLLVAPPLARGGRGARGRCVKNEVGENCIRLFARANSATAMLCEREL